MTITPAVPVASRVAPKEVGGQKTLSQHVGNAGFGATSIAAFTESLGTMLETAVEFPGVDAVPGLNLGVAVIESYNSVRKLREKDPIVAATSAGNAAGSLGTFLAQLSLAPIAFGGALQSNTLLGYGAALGAVGGVLGIAAGVAEIRQGREIQQAGGSSRTTAMGCLDITSGLTSLSGAGFMAAGMAPLGIALMMAANVVDLAGIGVDYLWKKADKKDEAEARVQVGAAAAPAFQPAAGTPADAAPSTLLEIAGAPALQLSFDF